MVLAQQGDEQAFSELAARFRAAVLAVAFSRTGDRDESEDLAQEVLIKAQQRLHDLRQPEAFPSWLRTIAHNPCRTWYRRSAKWPESLENASPTDRHLIDDNPGPLKVVLKRERQRAWRRALTLLPEANRIALLMYVWGGCSHAEIAAFAGVPVSTVEGKIYRAKGQLPRLLNRPDAAELLGEPLRKWQRRQADE